jgi:hypothetical protein
MICLSKFGCQSGYDQQLLNRHQGNEVFLGGSRAATLDVEKIYAQAVVVGIHASAARHSEGRRKRGCS